MQYPDVEHYGIRHNAPSTWYKTYGYDGIELQRPTLDITIYNGRVNNKTFKYTPTNATYTLPYIEENAVCQPVALSASQQTYQWGFSVPQLEVTLILLTIWTFGIYIMWLSAHLKLRSRGRYEVPHGLKAVLYLADSIRDDFNGLGEEAELLTDEELRRLARKELRDGKIKIQASEFQTDHSLWRSSWHWLKHNYLWALVYPAAVAHFFSSFSVASLLLSLVMSFAMAAGWGRKTRAVIAWAVFIIGIPIFLYAKPLLLIE